MLLEKARGFDLLGFQFRDKNSEREWTKGDVFAHFGVTTESEIGRSGQIVATYFFLRNSAAGRRFVEKWEELVADFHLLSDENSHEPNWAEFKNHRHDQSLLSMLVKCAVIPELRVGLEEKRFPEPGDFPIHTWRRRDRSGARPAAHEGGPGEIVAQGDDGSIELRAAQATLHGTRLRRETSGGIYHIGYWEDAAEWVDWPFTIARPGTYRVSVEVAAKKPSELTVSSSAQVLHAGIAPTGGFDRFETVDVGRLDLASPGLATLSLRPVAQRWKAVNLRALRLTASCGPRSVHTHWRDSPGT